MNPPTKDDRPIRKKPWLVRWYGEYDPRTGRQKRYSKSFTRRVDAETFIRQKQKEFDAGMARDERHITLRELTSEFMENNRNSHTAATRRSYSNTINRLLHYFHPDTPIKKIRRQDAERFVAQITYVGKNLARKKRKISDSARSNQLRNAKKIFNSARQWNYITNNPFQHITIRIADAQAWHYVSPDEFQAILSCAPTTLEEAFYAVQYGCGLRTGEAINLLWNGSNIDFELNRITLVNRPGHDEMPPFTLKDKEHRSISMPTWVSALLIQLQLESDTECPFVFLTKDRWEVVRQKWNRKKKTDDWINRDLRNNTLRSFKTRCKNAGIVTHERIMLHCLRKSWACNLANNGVPAHTLQKIGGWSSIDTCQQFYLKCSDENEKKAVEILNQMVSLDL